jgi:tRNA pseudouridine38-40 synthase
VQQALVTILRESAVSLTVAGRTDAGVHATGQVAHFDLPAAVWAEAGPRLVRRLAGVLPADVRVHRAVAVPAEFDARFAGLWRRYEYRLSDLEGGGDPRLRRHVLAWPRPLDVDAMALAAARLVGRHDFVAFCKWRDGGTSIRTIESFDVARVGNQILATVQADAFCHSMVRSLMGALLAVGEGRRDVDWPAQLLTWTARSDDITVAPAHGLTLVAIGYPPDAELAARTMRTRAKRTPGDVAGA